MLRAELDVEVTVQIARPRDEVWAFASDVSRLPEWFDEFEAAEVLGDGPPHVGATIRYRLAGGREGTYELLEWEPPRRIAWEGPPVRWLRGGIAPRGWIELADRGQVTEFTGRYQPHIVGPPALLRPYVARWTRRHRTLGAARLRRLIEQQDQ